MTSHHSPPKGMVGMLLSIVLVAACGSTPQASDSPPSGTGSAPASLPTEPLVVAVQTLASENWSPWLTQNEEELVTQHVFDTLIRVDPETLDPVPGLALSWDLSDDLKTWTFTLRPDVPFHDGYGTVTADDVKFSWEQLIREDSLMAQAPLLRQAIGGDLANFKIISPLEFSVTATDPLLILPTQLTDQAAGLLIQSKKYWDEKGDAAALHPIGTGPYKFVSQQSGVGVKLQGVDSHPFRATPTFRDVEIRIIGDNSTRMAAVQSGDADIGPISPLQLREAKAAGLRIESVRNVGLVNMMFGGFYPTHANYDRDAPWIQADTPEKGLAIRQALSMAIDRQTIIDAVYAGEGDPVACPLVCFPGFPWTDTGIAVTEYNPEQAKQLLAEGGYPDGFEATVWLFEQGGRPGTADVGEAIVGMWEAIGVTIKRQPTEQAQFLPFIQERDTGGYLWVYITPFYPDPAVGVQVAYARTSTRAHFNDPAIDRALEDLRTIPDREQRYERIKEMSRELAASVSAIPLFDQVSPYVLGPRIDAWQPIPGYGKVSAIETITSK